MTIRGKSNPKNRIGFAKAELKNRNSEKVLAKTKTIILEKIERKRKTQKKVEYTNESSLLSFLFSINNFINELFIPKVAIDLFIEVKFLKLPKSAIPEVPKIMDTIFVDITPKTKLVPTEKEFRDNTFRSTFCFSFFNITNFLLLWLDYQQRLHFQGCFWSQLSHYQ